MPYTELPAHPTPVATSPNLFADAAIEAMEKTGDRCNRLIMAWSQGVSEAAFGMMETGGAIGRVCGEMNGAYRSAATDAYTKLSTLGRRAAGCRNSDDITKLETEGAGIVGDMASTFGKLHAETCMSVCKAMQPALTRASTASDRLVRSLSQ